MEATIERRHRFYTRRRTLRSTDRPRVMACGWCKGFVHEEWVSDMQRYVHDEKPITDHEVLPYQVRQVDRERFIAAIDLTVDMAHDYALETRIRRLIEAHWASRETPRTLVMNTETWHRLMWELDGKGFHNGIFWTPQPEGQVLDPSHHITTYYGLPILIKDFMPDLEVIVGV